MSEGVARKPRSLLARILRAGAIFGGVITIVGSIYLWFEAQAATREWSNLGGTISAEGNLFAPETVDLGAAPGKPTARDVDALCKALKRMRRLPGCVHLNLQAFGDFGFDDDAIEQMLEAFRPVELTAGHVDVDDEALRLLASNGSTARVNLASCPVTAEGLATLLDQPRIRLVRIGSNELTDEDREGLKAKYGRRIIFLLDGLPRRDGG